MLACCIAPPAVASPALRSHVRWAGDQFPDAIDVGDIDGDGQPDAAVLGGDAERRASVAVLAGRGDGSFVPRATVRVPPVEEDIAVSDLNGDGRADFAVASDNGVTVFLSRSNWTFVRATYKAHRFSYALAIADLNGDGSPDLAVANNDSSDVSVLLGRGDGSFGAAANYRTHHNSAGEYAINPGAVAVGDLNDDGNPDLVVADVNSSRVSVLLGRGDGSFGPVGSYAADRGPDSIALADINGDGSLDLAVANEYSRDASILIGRGDGRFVLLHHYGDPESDAVGVALTDVNRDGHPDLVIAHDGSHCTPFGCYLYLTRGHVGVWLGRGNFAFRDELSYDVGDMPSAMAVANVNGDDRPDLLTLVDGGVSALLTPGLMPVYVRLTGIPHHRCIGGRVRIHVRASGEPPLRRVDVSVGGTRILRTKRSDFTFTLDPRRFRAGRRYELDATAYDASAGYSSDAADFRVCRSRGRSG